MQYGLQNSVSTHIFSLVVITSRGNTPSGVFLRCDDDFLVAFGSQIGNLPNVSTH